MNNKYIELFKNNKRYALYHKEIDDDEILLICEALAKNTTLEKLDLYNNKISNKGAKALAKNTTLRKLYLCNKEISDNLLKQININIENNNKRQKLSILTTNIIETNNIEIPRYYPKILLKY